MICTTDKLNSNYFDIKVTGDELISLLKALYWYEDKLTNMERSTCRDNAEWDTVVWIRQQLGNMLKVEAKLN